MADSTIPPRDQHPAPELLVAYHQQRLAMDQAEDVRDHLVACADCRTQLLELADLLDADGRSAAEELSGSELAAAWQRQRERLQPTAPVVPMLPPAATSSAPPWSWRTAASVALISALAIAVVAQRRTIERLEQPQTNPPLVNLVPIDSVRGGQESLELRFPAGVERAWVILNPSESLDQSSYQVVIATVDGRVVHTLHELQTSEAGNLRLEMPRTLLKPGSYKILLQKKTGSRPQRIGEFRLTVRH